MKNKILDALCQERTAAEYPDGSTPLLRFIYYVKSLPVESQELSEIQQQLIDVAHLMASFSSEWIRDIFSFVDGASLPVDEFFKIISEKEFVDVLSRAEVMRFMARSEIMDIRTILDDEEVKKYHFWIWIDALVKKNWRLTVVNVSERLSSPSSDDVKQLYFRLLSWRKTRKPREFSVAIEEWLQILQGESRGKLVNYLNHAGKLYGGDYV